MGRIQLGSGRSLIRGKKPHEPPGEKKRAPVVPKPDIKIPKPVKEPTLKTEVVSVSKPKTQPARKEAESATFPEIAIGAKKGKLPPSTRRAGSKQPETIVIGRTFEVRRDD